MKYRPEIDGLRAVAVISVVLFHARFPFAAGGFVGVDVFFVISGYLITTLIARELSDGAFRLSRFYERRARRILPALLFVVAVCVLLAWMFIDSGQMSEFSQSLISVATFSSNIHFWRTNGYFSTPAELKPLLHTWSLSVEEQYYLIFPPFLILAWRFGRKWVCLLYTSEPTRPY